MSEEAIGGPWINLLAQPWVILFGGASREQTIIAIREHGIAVSAVVVPERRKPGLEAAVSALRAIGCEVVETTKAAVAGTLASFVGRPILSIGFPYLLDADVLARHPVRLNLHPTLLPRYRGPTTGAYIILNREPVAGSTVHVLDEGMDTGPIVAQSHVNLTPFDTIRSMQRKVYQSEPALVLDALRKLDAGHLPVAQDERLATSFPDFRRPADSEIDPSKPLTALIDAIRASDPEQFPAFFWYNGQKVFIRLWREDRPTGEEDAL